MATIGVNKQDVLRLLATQANGGTFFNNSDTYIIEGDYYSYSSITNELTRIDPSVEVPVRYNPRTNQFVAEGYSPPVPPATGWADYTDSTYTEGSPFRVPANTDTMLPNDGVNGPKSYLPEGVELYDAANGLITGRTGDALLITLDYKIERVNNSGEFDLEVWWDIGGAVGELYRRYHRLRGAGLTRHMITTTLVYTLDTWEANGATTYIRTSVATDVFDIRYVIARVHTAQM